MTAFLVGVALLLLLVVAYKVTKLMLKLLLALVFLGAAGLAVWYSFLR